MRESRNILGRKPWLLVAYINRNQPNGQARIVSDHASKDAAKRAARKRGVEVAR
jgi:hypothetical protein